MLLNRKKWNWCPCCSRSPCEAPGEHVAWKPPCSNVPTLSRTPDVVLNDNHSPMMLLTINLECRLINSLFYVSQPILPA